MARSDGVIDWLSTRRPAGVDHGDHRHHANLGRLRQIDGRDHDVHPGGEVTGAAGHNAAAAALRKLFMVG